MFHQPIRLCLLLMPTFIISSAFASEQSSSNGFVNDASASVLLRNGFFYYQSTDKQQKSSTWGQSAMMTAQSGFTQGTIGFAAGVIGDMSIRLTSDNPSKTTIPFNSNGEPYRHWARGGAYAKARISNTTLTYGTQVIDLPVLSSNTGRFGSEYFTGSFIQSHEIKNLELVAGKFTKNQMTNQLSTDKDRSGNPLKQAYVWGGKYHFNDQFNAAYYGLDNKDKLNRHYADLNYKLPLADKKSLTFDLNGYATQFKAGAESYVGTLTENKNNYIWAFATTYSQGPHSVMLAYQQSTGGIGYDYGVNADGYNSIALPNSYLSDFNGKSEKSAQVQYNLDFADYGIPGLSWTSAYAYGWNIDTQTTTNAKEHEFFNQVKYTVQSGFAKGVKFRARNSIYRADTSYSKEYIPSMNEWRIYMDIPIKLF